MENFSDSSDECIAGEIRNSNADAFKALYFRYYESLYRFLLIRTGSQETSRDFVQDVFAGLWQNRRTLKTGKSLRAYLFRIANNLVIDHFRRQKTQHLYSERFFNFEMTENPELRRRIFSAIEELPEKLRTVFVLSRFDGLKYTEIAQACEISIKTVEKRMSRALRVLRKELSG
ncbi:MAG: RNA polymerase sigma-70 factor [Calditrichaeota bacterium]|nr:RNA polymerase sigma-70 factor [Calditrichota bacterium]